MTMQDMSTPELKMHGRKPMRYCNWFRAPWFVLSLGGVVAMATFTGLSTGAPVAYLFGQIILGLSAYIALFFLANRPLFNPIQAVVSCSIGGLASGRQL